MSESPDVEPSPPVPVTYDALPEQKVSPFKPHRISNYHLGKHGINLPPNATLDRRLEGDSSMGTTVLVEWKDFMKSDILPAIPIEQSPATLKAEMVSAAKAVLSTRFYGNSEPKKLRRVKEDDIADTVVGVINTVLSGLELPEGRPRYKAALSRYKANPSDKTRSKVDAAIYEEDHMPKKDWLAEELNTEPIPEKGPEWSYNPNTGLVYYKERLIVPDNIDSWEYASELQQEATLGDLRATYSDYDERYREITGQDPPAPPRVTPVPTPIEQIAQQNPTPQNREPSTSSSS
ncbi:hypothetical protein TRAPUB_6849, partial [Trametes pubescens]